MNDRTPFIPGSMAIALKRLMQEFACRLHPTFTMQDRFVVELQRAQKRASKSLSSFEKFMQRGQDQWDQLNRQIQGSLGDMRPFVKNLKEIVEKIPERSKLAYRTLAERGWYVDPNMPVSIMYESVGDIKNGMNVKADNRLCKYMLTAAEEFGRRNLEISQDRRRILNQAIEAHKESRFALSVPVFLSQADGICYEITGFSPFSRREGIPEIVKYFREINIDDFSSALILPLTEPMPISASSQNIEDTRGELRRHMILHGIDLDYDTKTNSCKSFSFLLYVLWVLREGKIVS